MKGSLGFSLTLVFQVKGTNLGCSCVCKWLFHASVDNSMFVLNVVHKSFFIMVVLVV